MLEGRERNEQRHHKTGYPVGQGAVALTVGLVPRRLVPKLSDLHRLLKMNTQ